MSRPVAFTSDYCDQCAMAIESTPTLNANDHQLPKKGMARCLRCGRVYGPVELVPLDDWDQHGMQAFDQDERN